MGTGVDADVVEEVTADDGIRTASIGSKSGKGLATPEPDGAFNCLPDDLDSGKKRKAPAESRERTFLSCSLGCIPETNLNLQMDTSFLASFSFGMVKIAEDRFFLLCRMAGWGNLDA